jgi:hypothetical protein
VQGSTAVILLNFCAKNPPHRQAEKRCASVYKTKRNEKFDLFNNNINDIILQGQE